MSGASYKCAKQNDVEGLKQLVEAGDSMSFKTFDDETLLHVAALRGSIDVVRYLLTQGLDVDAKTKHFEVFLLFMKPLYMSLYRVAIWR